MIPVCYLSKSTFALVKIYIDMKMQIVFPLIVFLMLSLMGFAQNRPIDGYGSNPLHPEWGAVGTNQLEIVPLAYSDGISAPSGSDRPNPRVISNTIFNQDGQLFDVMGLSDYAWVWGQFVDHNITLVPETSEEVVDIDIPTGDPFFDPFWTGEQKMRQARSAYDPATGTSPANPRRFPNMITSFIDGSGVYGSSQEVASWLRTHQDGKLKTSAGDLLPYNTIDGQKDSEVDPNAPFMAMPLPNEKYFIAGDVRANENALLTVIHTTFVREHNRLCDKIKAENPLWGDELIYQKARKIVGGLIQHIVYDEWLPTLGVEIPEYSGFNANVNPGIFSVFSVAAYRYGHTVIGSDIARLDAQGQSMPGDLKLRDVFFQPNVLEQNGLEPFARGMSVQMEQDFDSKMVHDLRNFLFGPPGSGGLDLATMNIQRGRDRGLPSYNTIREELGLGRINDFSELTSNDIVVSQFRAAYQNDVDKIDPWPGMLAEDQMADALFGPTVMTILSAQFTNLRDGDIYFYKNDPNLTSDDLEYIESSTLGDVLMRNMNEVTLPSNVFIAQAQYLATDDITTDNEVVIFPNPTSGRFSVSLADGNTQVKSLRVVDYMGKLVYLDDHIDYISDLQVRLPQDVLPGIYFVHINTDKGRLTKQLIVK